MERRDPRRSMEMFRVCSPRLQSEFVDPGRRIVLDVSQTGEIRER